MIKKELTEILRCPDCSGSINNELQCNQCKRIYVREDGIYAFMPGNQLALPPVYSDPDYIKYHQLSAQTDEYFYHNRNPLINWINASGYRQIRNILRKEKGLIFECGCGTGAFLAINQSIDLKNYVMLDINYNALKLIKKPHLLKGIVHGTAYNLPFIDNSFDIAISHAQFEHLCYLDWALEEIRRILMPEGKCIVSVPTEGGFFWRAGRRLTSARYFGKKLNIDYNKVNRIDHFNTIHQIDRAIKRHFLINKRMLFPFKIPSFHLNFTCTYILSPLKK